MKIVIALAVAAALFGAPAYAQSALFECGPTTSDLVSRLEVIGTEDFSDDEADEDVTHYRPAGISIFGFPATALSKYYYEDGFYGEDSFDAEVSAPAAEFVAAAERSLGGKCEATTAAGSAPRCKIETTRTGRRYLLITSSPKVSTACVEEY